MPGRIQLTRKWSAIRYLPISNQIVTYSLVFGSGRYTLASQAGRKMKSKLHSWRVLAVMLAIIPTTWVLANSSAINSGDSGPESRPIWVFFWDKGDQEAVYLRGTITAPQVTERARQRRVQRGTRDILNYMDIDVPQEYIQEVTASGAQIRVISRWFNAISVMANQQEETYINNLPDVKKTKRVMRVSRRFLKRVERDPDEPTDSNVSYENYGNSFAQLDQIDAITAHENGYTGAGVWVLMLDTGFMTSHVAFQPERIVGEYDFIQDDSVTSNQEGDTIDQQNHGTATASVVGGYDPGFMLGAAYDCSFLLAKTEIVDQEVQIEEDYYVAGLEWGEALGADVVSSSLGYIDWYSFDDLDGNTAITTRAVDIAASLGMVCVTAAGNEGGSSWGHIIAPADADSVISVGAVTNLDSIASFSSPGPTADNRVKPEVVARGVNTFAAGTVGDNAFVNASGTSLSTPLVAGATALILQAHPDWTPMMVREALMMTANNAGTPNNHYGYGLIDVMAAINYSFDVNIGDITQDGQVNISDVVLLMDWILSGVNLNETQIERADLNGDSMINILDAVQLVEAILTH